MAREVYTEPEQGPVLEVGHASFPIGHVRKKTNIFMLVPQELNLKNKNISSSTTHILTKMGFEILGHLMWDQKMGVCYGIIECGVRFAGCLLRS